LVALRGFGSQSVQIVAVQIVAIVADNQCQEASDLSWSLQDSSKQK
jgi:hypothetical protein